MSKWPGFAVPCQLAPNASLIQDDRVPCQEIWHILTLSISMSGYYSIAPKNFAQAKKGTPAPRFWLLCPKCWQLYTYLKFILHPFFAADFSFQAHDDVSGCSSLLRGGKTFLLATSISLFLVVKLSESSQVGYFKLSWKYGLVQLKNFGHNSKIFLAKFLKVLSWQQP